MRPIAEMDSETVSKIKYVLCDIDDTITNQGKLVSESYNAMWKLYNAGYHVIPVTGRPAGWCDLIVREWPVKAVVGENGAFVYYFEDSQFKTFIHPEVATSEIHNQLDSVKSACLEQIPGCRPAKDQPFRIFDLAIDFNEDPPYLGLGAAEKIKNVCVSMGAEAKISSIHVNVWFGKYDKLKMAKLFFEEILKEENIREKVIFFGDSPNDEPMFRYFPNSCGVANVSGFVDRMDHLPSYITKSEGGLGFAEAVDHLLSLK